MLTQPEQNAERMLRLRHIKKVSYHPSKLIAAHFPAEDLPDSLQFPTNFSGCLQLTLLCHSLRLWQSGAKEWIIEQHVDPMKIPTDQDSLIRMITRYMDKTGIEDHAWIRTLSGDIWENGLDNSLFKMKAEHHHVLETSNCPGWMIELIGSGPLLLSKEETINETCRDWYNRLHEK